MNEPRIIAAVATMAASRDHDLAARLEAAMSQAVRDALADGVSIEHTDELRRRILSARATVLRAP